MMEARLAAGTLLGCCGLCVPSKEQDPEINHLGSSKAHVDVYTSQ